MYYKIKHNGHVYHNAILVGNGIEKHVLVHNGMFKIPSSECWFHCSNIPSDTKIRGVFA